MISIIHKSISVLFLSAIWSDGATWAGGAIPLASDHAMIKSGLTVTLDITTAV